MSTKRKRDEKMENNEISEPPKKVLKKKVLKITKVFDPVSKVLIYEGQIDPESNLYYGTGKLYNKTSGVLIYDGEFKNGEFNGPGSAYKSFTSGLTCVNTICYVLDKSKATKLFLSGVFENGIPLGHVKMFHDNGKLLYEGKISKKRTFEDKNGKLFNRKGYIVYEGAFLKSKFHGNGILYDHENGSKNILHKGEFFYGFILKNLSEKQIEIQQLSKDCSPITCTALMSECLRSSSKKKTKISFGKCVFTVNGKKVLELFKGENNKLKMKAERGIEFDGLGRPIFIGKFEKPFSFFDLSQHRGFARCGVTSQLFFYEDTKTYKSLIGKPKLEEKLRDVKEKFYISIVGNFDYDKLEKNTLNLHDVEMNFLKMNEGRIDIQNDKKVVSSIRVKKEILFNT